MERLIAKRPVLYQGRQYEQGEALPAHDPVMVDAWRRAGSAELVNDAAVEAADGGQDGTESADATQTQGAADTTEGAQDAADATGGAQENQENADGDHSGDDTDMVEGHLDPAQLESMSKEELVALAKEAGVELPRGAAKALIVERLAAATFQAPANDGSAQ